MSGLLTLNMVPGWLNQCSHIQLSLPTSQIYISIPDYPYTLAPHTQLPAKLSLGSLIFHVPHTELISLKAYSSSLISLLFFLQTLLFDYHDLCIFVLTWNILPIPLLFPNLANFTHSLRLTLDITLGKLVWQAPPVSSQISYSHLHHCNNIL